MDRDKNKFMWNVLGEHAHSHTCMNMYTHTHTHTHTHAHARTHTHTHTHTRTHTYTHALTHAHAHTHTYARAPTRTHARTHTHTHIHTWWTGALPLVVFLFQRGVVLAAAYSKYRRYGLSCLPFVWHFFSLWHTHVSALRVYVPTCTRSSTKLLSNTTDKQALHLSLTQVRSAFFCFVPPSCLLSAWSCLLRCIEDRPFTRGANARREQHAYLVFAEVHPRSKSVLFWIFLSRYLKIHDFFFWREEFKNKQTVLNPQW